MTKDYPGDTGSGLDPEGRWRLNIHVDRATFRRLTGEDPGRLERAWDHALPDTVLPHPVYGALAWIAVVNPGRETTETVRSLLRSAHAAAKARFERRRDTGASSL